MDRANTGVTDANSGVRFAYREFVTPGMLMLVIGVSSGLIVLFTFIGPFGTRYTLSWNGRLAFCLVNGALCLLICYPAVALTLFLARFRTSAQIALALAVYGVIMAIPCGAITYGVYGVFHGAPLPSRKLPETYLVCMGCIVAATVLVHYVLHLRVVRYQLLADKASARPKTDVPLRTCAERPDRTPQDGPDSEAAPRPAGSDRPLPDVGLDPNAAPPPPGTVQAGRAPHAGPVGGTERPIREGLPEPAATPPPPSFLDRLPPQLGRDVVYLKVSGHYLEVVTTLGSGVILQRLMDAVRELGSRGMQTHRSYWVAHRHVRYFVRRERRTMLHLTGDYEVPVSRTFLPEVRLRMKGTPPRAPLRRRPLSRPDQQKG